MYFNFKKKKKHLSRPGQGPRKGVFLFFKKQNNIIFIKLLIQDICEPTDTDIRK
jgi:hypothetical protein